LEEVALRREDGSIVCERCLLAETALTRMRGLLGRRELPTGEGILLKPAPSVHMWFMRFPIDAVFLDDDMRVVKIAADLKPWRMAGARGAKSCLEIGAGEAARRGLSVGDRLVAGSALAPTSPGTEATPS
jgi:uncharacterized membrane protein (UPF0127 family)